MTTQHDSKILVVGATGTVGGATARALLARGAEVRALVRTKERAAHLRAAELVQGDLRDVSALAGLLEGVHTAFYVSPHEPDEEALAEGFIHACEQADVRLVFVGVHVDGRNRLMRALLRWYLGRLMPAYVPKMRLSERARTSRARPVVLMPTNYFDNDALFREELVHGAFVQPFERPFNRVAVQDIAEAAANVCLDRAFPPGAYPIVGPESLDGPACARIWSQVLGRKVTYRVDDNVFRAAAARSARGKKVTDLISSYGAIRNIELRTSQRDLARTAWLLGRAPTPYAQYVEAQAHAWGMT